MMSKEVSMKVVGCKLIEEFAKFNFEKDRQVFEQQVETIT